MATIHRSFREKKKNQIVCTCVVLSEKSAPKKYVTIKIKKKASCDMNNSSNHLIWKLALMFAVLQMIPLTTTRPIHSLYSRENLVSLDFSRKQLKKYVFYVTHPWWNGSIDIDNKKENCSAVHPSLHLFETLFPLWYDFDANPVRISLSVALPYFLES